MKRKLVLGAMIASLLIPAAASASTVNVKANTNNTVHPNNTLRCSGQCDIVSDNDVDILP